MSTRIHKLWPSWLLLAGLVLAFAGERVFAGDPNMRPIFAILAAVAFGAAVVVRAIEFNSADADRKPVLGTILACTTGVAASMALYALIPLILTGDDSATERIRGVLWALWPIGVAVFGLPLLFLESAVSPVAYIDRYERAQVRRSTTRGLALALFLAVLFVGNYLAVQHDEKFELSAANTASAGPQTRQAVRDLTEDVRVVLFFPRANDVGERVARYFEPLTALNPRLTVERLDHALATELAKRAEVSENGFVALYRNAAHERIRVGVEYRSARTALRQFDNNFVKSLIRVTTAEKIAYFYEGHDERAVGSRRRQDKRPALRKLRKQLESWRFVIKPLSVGQGSATEIPNDADILFIVGPEKPFLDAELEVLRAAIKRGVRMFIALEAERTGDALAGLLGPLGLRFDNTLLAATTSHVPLSKTRADQSYLYSNQFSTHPSVTTMTRNTGKIAALFYKPGALVREDSGRLPGLKTDIVLTARPDTYADANGNLSADSGEARKPFGLAAAVTATSTTGDKTKEGRVFVVADADVVGDDLFNLLPGNVYFMRDVILWLQRESEVFVPTSEETDVKIVHKGTEDALVFYGTTLAFPVMILIMGAFATRRKRR